MIRNGIAVVTPVYNGEAIILKTINSLIYQSFNNWISIIVDDGSTDSTSILLEKYNEDKRFVIISLPENKGRGYARKIALEKVIEVGAKYMCMLDADDLYYPNKLQLQFEYMESHENIVLASFSMALVDNKYDIVSVLASFSTEKVLKFKKYDDYIGVPHACSIIRVSEIGNETFDDTFRFSEDQDFMIRFLINKEYAFVPIISYLYSRDYSFSFSKYKRSLDYIEKTYSKLPITSRNRLKKHLINKVKILYVVTLKSIGLINLYIGKLGRKPTVNEINFHHQWLTDYIEKV